MVKKIIMPYETIEFLEVTAQDLELDAVDAAWFVAQSIEVLQKKRPLEDFLSKVADSFQFNTDEMTEVRNRLMHAQTLAVNTENPITPVKSSGVQPQNSRVLLEKIITPQTIAHMQSTIIEKAIPDPTQQAKPATPIKTSVDPYREPIE